MQATAGGEQRTAPASVFELSVQPFCSQGAPTGALIPSNRCLHDACEVGWRARRDQWNLGMGHYTRHTELDATLEAMLCCWDSNISTLVH
jgi:hypothetical protein